MADLFRSPLGEKRKGVLPWAGGRGFRGRSRVGMLKRGADGVARAVAGVAADETAADRRVLDSERSWSVPKMRGIGQTKPEDPVTQSVAPKGHRPDQARPRGDPTVSGRRRMATGSMANIGSYEREKRASKDGVSRKVTTSRLPVGSTDRLSMSPP